MGKVHWRRAFDGLPDVSSFNTILFVEVDVQWQVRLYFRCIATIRVNVRGLSADTESRSSPLQGSASFPRRDTHPEYIWLRCLHPQALNIMLCEHHTLRLPASGLWMSANRYRPTGNDPLRGVTLVFAHCTSGRTTSPFTPMGDNIC